MPTKRVIAFSLVAASVLMFSGSAAAQNVDLTHLNSPNSWSGGDSEGDILQVKAELKNQDTVQTLWFDSHIKGQEGNTELAFGGSGKEFEESGASSREDGRHTDTYLNIGGDTCGLYLVENDMWGYQTGMVQYGEGTIIDADGEPRERSTENYILQEDSDGSGAPELHDRLKNRGFNGMSFKNNLDFKQSGKAEMRYSLLCAPEQGTDENEWRTCQGGKTAHFRDTNSGDVYLCGSGDDDWQVRENVLGSCSEGGRTKNLAGANYLCAQDSGGKKWIGCSSWGEKPSPQQAGSNMYSCNTETGEWEEGRVVCEPGDTTTKETQNGNYQLLCGQGDNPTYQPCDGTTVTETVNGQTCTSTSSSGKISYEWSGSDPSAGDIQTGVLNSNTISHLGIDIQANGNNPAYTQYIYDGENWNQCNSDSPETVSIGTEQYSCQQQGNDFVWQPAGTSCEAGTTKDSPDGTSDKYLCTGDDWKTCTPDTSIDGTYGGKSFSCNAEEGEDGSFTTTGFSCGGRTSIAASVSESSYSNFPIEINGCTTKKHFIVKLKSGLNDIEWNYRYNENLDDAVTNGVQCLHSTNTACEKENFEMERDGNEFTITISNDGGRLPWGPKDSPQGEGQPVPYDISLAAYDGSTSGTSTWVDNSLSEVCSSTGMCGSSDIVSGLDTTVGVVEHSYGEPVTLIPGQQLDLSGGSSQLTCAGQVTFGGPMTSRKLYFGEGTGIRNSYSLNHIEDEVPNPNNPESSGDTFTIGVADAFAETSDVLTFARDTEIQFMSYTGQMSEEQALKLKPICNSGTGSGSTGSGDSAPGTTTVTSYRRSNNPAWVKACIDGAGSQSSGESSDESSSESVDLCEPEDNSITVDEIVNTLRPCISSNMPKDKTPGFSGVSCYEIVKSYCNNAGTLNYNGPESLEGVETNIDNTCSRGGSE